MILNVIFFQDPMLSSRAGSSTRPAPSGRAAPSHIKAGAAEPTQSAGDAPGLAEPRAVPAHHTTPVSVIVSCVVACPPSHPRPGHGDLPHHPLTTPPAMDGVEVNNIFFKWVRGAISAWIQFHRGVANSAWQESKNRHRGSLQRFRRSVIVFESIKAEKNPQQYHMFRYF